MFKRIQWRGQRSFALYRGPFHCPRVRADSMADLSQYADHSLPTDPPAPMPFKEPKGYKANLPFASLVAALFPLSSRRSFRLQPPPVFPSQGCSHPTHRHAFNSKTTPWSLGKSLRHSLSSAQDSQGNRQGVLSKAITSAPCGHVERSFDSTQMYRLANPLPTCASLI